MLPIDDSIEIIDQNNNEHESKKNAVVEDDYNVYEATDKQNVKDIKVLLIKDKVAVTVYTLEVPFLCSVLDIITTIFKKDKILVNNYGYKLVENRTERRIIVIEMNDPRCAYQYIIKLESPTTISDKPEVYDDCQIVEYVEKVVPQKYLEAQCSTPKSVDSQETYFEPAEKAKVDTEEEEQFYSCLNEENDIDVKKNDENCDALFAILGQNDDAENKSSKREDRESEGQVRSAAKPFEIETSKFYSTPDRKTQSSSNQSQKTVQLGDSPILSKRRSQRLSKSPRDAILAVYPPPPARGGITIYKDNYKCLGDGEYLNDVIIDFYLKHLVLEVLSEEDRKRTHVFSSQFFTRLSKPPASDETEVEVPESERRHIGVQRWTKNVNIFEKDFVVVPINEHYHWNVAIICYPGLVGTVDQDSEGLIRPCILFFDSLSSKSKDRIAAILRGYLSQEYLAKNGEVKSFSNKVLKAIYPRVPRQTNATDCGLYVLQYVEQFFKSPIVDFSAPMDLSQWFKSSVIRCKRAEIATLVTELARNYNPDKDVSIPALRFPSDQASSDEDDFLLVSTKKKSPIQNGECTSYVKDSNMSSNTKTTSLDISKKKKGDQSKLDEWFDRVRDAPSTSYNTSLDFKPSKYELDQNDAPSTSIQLISSLESKPSEHPVDEMDVDEDDVLIDETNISDKKDVSLEIISDPKLPNTTMYYAKTPSPKYRNKSMCVLRESFSGHKSHMFQKSSIFSDEAEERPFGIARPKRECREKLQSKSMMELANQIRARKRKNELKAERNDEESNKSIKWIDESVFKPEDRFYNPFSVLSAADDQGIPPTISYSKFKIQKKNKERTEQY